MTIDKKQKSLQVRIKRDGEDFLLEGFHWYKGNLAWLGTWKPTTKYEWNQEINIPLVLYNKKLYIAKYYPEQGTPPPEDKKGWMLFPGGGGSSGVIEIHGDTEIIVEPSTGIVQLKIGETIVRTKQFNEVIESLSKRIDAKEDRVIPTSDNMLKVYNQNGTTYWSKLTNEKILDKGTFTERDLIEGYYLYIIHGLNEKTYLDYFVYNENNIRIYPDTKEVNANASILYFENLLPLNGTYKYLIVKF